MVQVAFEAIQKTFGTTVAIPSLDLVVDSGEFVSLLGPSGCGKSTTLRMLAGLEQPTRGRILIDGQEVSGLTPGERDIAMVFQSYALYPHMTVAQNLAYPLKKRGVAKAERGPRVQTVAELLQIVPLLNRKPKELSGGQQQRVALGRALVRNPSVFLLDEPLSNLDAKLRAHMRAELIELHRRLGKTMLYVTHDQLEAMTMSTRIAVMMGGVLQQYGSPAEVYGCPANRLVAEFIGTPAMTILDASVTGSTLSIGALEVDLGDRRPALSGETSQVSVGIRPEDVIVGEGEFSARVRLVEPTGHESIVILDAGDFELTARTAGDCSLAAGQEIAFDLRRERLHLFGGEDGRRIEDSQPAHAAEKALNG